MVKQSGNNATMRSSLLKALAITTRISTAFAAIPDYILTYAPLVYLDINEQYYPSDIAAQVRNTYPALNFSAITSTSDLTLSNLSSVNTPGGCSSFDECDVYLTSRDTVTSGPPSPSWLYGVLPNPATGETENATSCAVIVTDHGKNTVDAFYMYFYAFNRGVPVGSPNGTVYGDHVGDWEHNMVRFINGVPVSVWYSQHSGGEAYTYNATLKNGSRPLAFSSKGGLHVMYSGASNDSTSYGPLWDPVAGSSAWYYTFTPSSPSTGTFTSESVPGRTSRGIGPTDWLYFYGRWGDKQYNASYPGQQLLGSITAVFTDGPTGPLDKDLNRTEICPDRIPFCSTSTVVPASSGAVEVQTVTRSQGSGTATRSGAGSATASSSAGYRSACGRAGLVLCLGSWVGVYLVSQL